jgi:hypothetical protein
MKEHRVGRRIPDIPDEIVDEVTRIYDRRPGDYSTVDHAAVELALAKYPQLSAKQKTLVEITAAQDTR